MAKQTVAICEAGFYDAPNRARVDIASDLSTVFDRSETLATYQAFANCFKAPK
jgi:hypothetical protein